MWNFLSGTTGVLPPDANSVGVFIGAQGPLVASSQTRIDDVFVGVAAIFADGFESGDTSAWSATVP